MSAEKYRGVGKVIAAGLGMAAVGVAGITLRNHRELTHRSIELPQIAQKIMDFEQRTLGIGDANIWAAVHRIHHQMTDVSLFPFYKAAHAIKTAEKNGISVPETFQHMDPFVDRFTRDEVLKIGESADRHVRTRMGDEYQRPSFANREELEKVLNPTEPTYYYPNYEKKRNAADFSQDDIARIFLTDPHSPALVAPRKGKLNGVRGVGTKGMFLYLAGGSDLFYARPDLKPDDLYTGEEAGKKEVSKAAVVAGFVLPSAAVLLYRGKYQPKDFAIAAAAGSAINGVRAGAEVAGGMAVNSLGHAGVLSGSKIIESIARREYRITLNPDGSLSTDTIKAGFLGKLLSYATLDEVGRQDFHHKYPGAVAYTDRKGFKAVLDAPWGSFTSSLVKAGIIKPGKGFPEGRPDVPHEGVLMIQAARVRQHSA